MKITAALGGLLLVTQIVLLSIQLNVLNRSNGHIRSQDAKVTRLYPLQKKTAENALPLIRDARGAIKPLRTQTGKLVSATDTLPELVSEAVPALRGTRQLVSVAIPALRGTDQLVSAVLGRDLIGTITRMAGDVHQSLELQRRSVSLQQQSLDLQRQALAILEQSRGIQSETLTHARNIDNKTGGGLTAP